MKRGKEISIDLPCEYNIVSGTIDNINPKSIYIQISAWGKPKTKRDTNYDSIIKNKGKRIKRKLFEVLDEKKFHKNKTIVDFNMASSGISYGKRSFMCVEVTLFQREPWTPINSVELNPTLSDISENIIKDVFEKDEDFTFYKTK